MQSCDGVVIICTRPDSSRLPGKVFKKIANVPVIEHILQRIEGCGLQIVLAVPRDCKAYDHLVNHYKFTLYEGDPESPLHRMADAIKDLFLDQTYVIRITHDDILIDTKTMMAMLTEAKKQKARYAVSPRIVEGAGVEIIHRENILKAAEERTEPTEYISYFVRSGKELIFKPRKEIERPYRLTLDYPKDYVVLETILREVGAYADLDQVVEFLDRHPYVLNINKLPTLSIYTCAYNAELFIDRTLDSIFHHHQWNPADYEYIVVDDGSIDSTLLKISRFGNDPRLKVFVNETNKGLASSSNIALSNASGAYVMRIDADDLLLPGALTTMLDQIKTEQSSIVYPAYREINKDESFISGVIDPKVNHHAGCAVMDKRMINEIRFTDGLKHWDSKDLYNRIKSKFKISYAQEPMFLYRRHERSLSAQQTLERNEALKQIAS